MEKLPESTSLEKSIQELKTTIEKTASFKRTLMRGVLNGVGTFIGATIVAAIAITILVQILKIFNIDLGIDGYLESLLPKD